MLLGIIFILIAGLLWSLGALIIHNAIKQKLNLFFIMSFPALVAAICCLPIMIFLPPPDCDTATHMTVFISLFLAGGLSIVSIFGLKQARQHERTGVIWYAAQVAFVFPFLMGILVFGERLTPVRLLGLVLVGTAAIILGPKFTRNHLKLPDTEKIWKIAAPLGFFCGGLSQCAFILPSFINGAESIGNTLRVFYYCSGTVIAAVALMIRWPSLLESRKCFIPSMLICFIMVVSFGFFAFRGFDAMAAAGYGAVAFPLVSACVISGVYLYRRYLIKEKIHIIQTIGFVLGLLGLITILL